MKVLSIVALVIAIAGCALGLHCQINIVPLLETTSGSAIWRHYHDMKMLIGNIAMLTGFLGIILGIISGVKKQKIGWIAIPFGLISLILGLLQATHMFDL